MRSQNRGSRLPIGTTALAVTMLLTVSASACSTGTGASATTSSTAMTGASTTAAGTITAPPSTTGPTAPAFPLVMPVGPDGFEYRGGGEDLETTGPNLLAAGPDGTVYIADPVGNRIWSNGPAGPSIIELGTLDIFNVTALAATADELILVEVFFAPERQRIHRLTPGGAIIDTIDLPSDARLEAGLSGVLVDDEGRVAIVLEGGVRFAFLDPETREFSLSDSIRLGGNLLRQVGQDYSVNGIVIAADLAGELGGLRILGAADGTVVLIREEVLSMSPIEVLGTVEWYDGTGGFAGSARIPLERQAISFPPGLALAEHARVLALIAGTDAVRVIDLEPTTERITG